MRAGIIVNSDRCHVPPGVRPYPFSPSDVPLIAVAVRIARPRHDPNQLRPWSGASGTPWDAVWQLSKAAGSGAMSVQSMATPKKAAGSHFGMPLFGGPVIRSGPAFLTPPVH